MGYQYNANDDETLERLRSFIGMLNEESERGSVVVVEGKRDAEALAAQFEDMTDARQVETLGSPVEVDLEIGHHRLFPEAEAGCRLRLARAGAYGIAVFRIAGTVLSAPDRVRQPVYLRLDGGVLQVGRRKFRRVRLTA